MNITTQNTSRTSYLPGTLKRSIFQPWREPLSAGTATVSVKVFERGRGRDDDFSTASKNA